MIQDPIQSQFSGIPREKALCFTGHRPEKLPQGKALDGLLRTLHYYICQSIEIGYTHFLTGLADGVDYYASDILFWLRRQYPQIRVIGVQPCDRQYEAFFSRCGYSLEHLRIMRENVDRLIVLPGVPWERGVFHRRNRLMVEHSSAIIAVCRDGRSGSMQTYHYARQFNLNFCRIYPDPPPGRIPEPTEWYVERSGL